MIYMYSFGFTVLTKVSNTLHAQITKYSAVTHYERKRSRLEILIYVQETSLTLLCTLLFHIESLVYSNENSY